MSNQNNALPRAPIIRLILALIFTLLVTGCFLYMGDSSAVSSLYVNTHEKDRMISEDEVLRAIDDKLTALGLKVTANGSSAPNVRMRFYAGPPTRGCYVEASARDVALTFIEGFGQKKQSEEVRAVVDALYDELSDKFGKKNVIKKFTKG